ncbi:MAG: SMP-30/gluconolactonase/LRE family protein [Planctomycetes bacterium]|nr:SMP-30/gluconolactonase/LRE family protein [Planctomycetota bacterium]
MRAILLLLLTATTLAQIQITDDRARDLITPDTRIEKLATDLKFTEGPIWLPDNRLLFSDIPARQWLHWTKKDGAKPWRQSEAANGNTLDRDGRVISCQHEARNVIRHEPDGTTTVLVDRHDGKRFNSPNDVAVRMDGTLWFTDPTYGLGKREREQDGAFVYRFDPASKTTTIVQRDFDQPNGVCFAPDHHRLYIADSGSKQRVGAFPVTAEGTLGEPTFWLDGGADGIRCDRLGNLYTTARDGVRIYDPKGTRLATIAFPEVPANCAFGGAGFDELFVTARTSLYRVQLRVPGAKMPAVEPTTATKTKDGQPD